MVLTAPHLSRKLRVLGYGVVADHNRQGLRVRRGALPGQVSVSVQVDARGERERLAEDVARSLDLLGYCVQWSPDADAAVLNVKYPKAGE